MPIRIFDKHDRELQIDLVQFSGGERHVQLGDFQAQATCTIRAQLRAANDIFDLLLTADALNQKLNQIKLNVEIPYLPYARQDRVCAPGQAFSLNMMAKVLKQIDNLQKLVVWDCHSAVGTKLTGAENVAAENIILSIPPLTDLIMEKNTVVVCPDKGAITRTRNIVAALGKDAQPDPIIYCEKLRNPETGEISHTEVKTEDLTNRTAVITDDICDGGFTFVKVAEQLKAKGADQVALFVTHGIFSKGLGVFDGLIDQIFTTDSFEQKPDAKLTVIPFQFPFLETK